MWKLFIDDERDPVTNDWIVARSSEAAKQFIVRIGTFPNAIAFDHDLGGDDTSIEFIRWIENALIDERYVLPVEFEYSIHSQNPVGAANIKSRMDQIIGYFRSIS